MKITEIEVIENVMEIFRIDKPKAILVWDKLKNDMEKLKISFLNKELRELKARFEDHLLTCHQDSLFEGK